MRSNSLIAMGQRIKAIRKEMRIKQEDMAKILGISSGYMSEIERGKTNPTADLLYKLIEHYQVNVMFLFHGEGEIKIKDETDSDKPAFSLDSAVDSEENVIWLMDVSTFFRNTIMGYASKILFENKGLIKYDIKMGKKNEGKNEEKQG